MSRLRDFVKRVMERIPAGGSDWSVSPAHHHYTKET